MKNKNYLGILVVVILAGSLAILNYSFKPVKQKNIGLQLYSIRDSIRKNVPAAIEKVAKMGYKFVEPAGYADGKIYGMDPVAFQGAVCKERHDGSERPCKPVASYGSKLG